VLNQLADIRDEEQIRREVQQVLNTFGTVESIHVFSPTPGNGQRVILATMLQVEHAIEAATRLGLRSFGLKSLIIPLPGRHD
jgi:hypothetical protein